MSKYANYENCINNNDKLKDHPNIKVWYSHFRGYIIRSYLDPITNRIVNEKIPYNQPNVFRNFLDDYFRYKLN